MSKELTEKWKNGELPEGTYYVMFLCVRYGTYEFEKLKGFGFDNDLAYIKEVLAPVPSYDEYKQLVSKTDELENKLKIATKALERIHQPAVGDIYNFETDELDHTKLQDIAYKALKEMEGVK